MAAVKKKNTLPWASCASLATWAAWPARLTTTNLGARGMAAVEKRFRHSYLDSLASLSNLVSLDSLVHV